MDNVNVSALKKRGATTNENECWLTFKREICRIHTSMYFLYIDCHINNYMVFIYFVIFFLFVEK